MLYFIVSIDTEEDMPNWRPEKHTTLKNIQYLPRLHELFQKHSVVPTYLVDQPVLEDDHSLNVIRELATEKNCEIGAHVHSWNTPPQSADEKNRVATYLNTHKEIIQREKISNFTNLFQTKLGFAPLSYRAGRYGFDLHSAKILAELGYKVDSSIAPIMDFTADGGPNFKKSTLQPAWIQKDNGPKILELPVTISLIHKFPQSFGETYFKIPAWSRIRGVLHRLNLARLLWLRPTTYTIGEMKQLADYVLDYLGIPVLNMMFHSSEVCSGTSPYNSTEKDVENFLERLDSILSYLLRTRNMQSVSMLDFAELCDSDRGESVFGYELPVLDKTLCIV